MTTSSKCYRCSPEDYKDIKHGQVLPVCDKHWKESVYDSKKRESPVAGQIIPDATPPHQSTWEEKLPVVVVLENETALNKLGELLGRPMKSNTPWLKSFIRDVEAEAYERGRNSVIEEFVDFFNKKVKGSSEWLREYLDSKGIKI